MLESIGNDGLKTVERIINGAYLTHEELLLKHLELEK